MDLAWSFGVCVECSHSKSEERRRFIALLVDRRAAATREASPDSGTRLPGGHQILARLEREMISRHAHGRAEARAGVLATSPAMAVGERAEQGSVDRIRNAPTGAGAVQQGRASFRGSQGNLMTPDGHAAQRRVQLEDFREVANDRRQVMRADHGLPS